MRPVLFYTIGYPGAGKSTLAARLSYWLSVEHLRGDKIGLELFRFPTYSAAEKQAVYDEMNRRAGTHLTNGRHVIYDAAINTRLHREQLQQLAGRYGGIALGLWVQTPVPLAKKRAGTARDSSIAGRVVRVIPPHVFDQYAAAFEAPRIDERVVVVSGNAAFPLQYRRLLRQIGDARFPRLVN